MPASILSDLSGTFSDDENTEGAMKQGSPLEKEHQIVHPHQMSHPSQKPATRRKGDFPKRGGPKKTECLHKIAVFLR